MFPWYWLVNWNPQVHFPWSGAVDQHIDPKTDWFFGNILPTAGNGQIEKQAFDVASYGRQLGWITELLLDVASQQSALSDEGSRAFSRLRDAKVKIDALKHASHPTQVEDIARQLAALKTHDPQAFAQLWGRLLKVFGESSL